MEPGTVLEKTTRTNCRKKVNETIIGEKKKTAVATVTEATVTTTTIIAANAHNATMVIAEKFIMMATILENTNERAPKQNMIFEYNLLNELRITIAVPNDFQHFTICSHH